jgi:hypothetical protein
MKLLPLDVTLWTPRGRYGETVLLIPTASICIRSCRTGAPQAAPFPGPQDIDATTCIEYQSSPSALLTPPKISRLAGEALGSMRWCVTVALNGFDHLSPQANESDNMNQRCLTEHSVGKGQCSCSSRLISNDGFSCILAQHARTHRYMQYSVPRRLDQASFLLSLLLRDAKQVRWPEGPAFLATLNRHMHICLTIHICEHRCQSRRLFLLLAFLLVSALQGFFVLLADLCISQSVTYSQCPSRSLRYLQNTFRPTKRWLDVGHLRGRKRKEKEGQNTQVK